MSKSFGNLSYFAEFEGKRLPLDSHLPGRLNVLRERGGRLGWQNVSVQYEEMGLNVGGWGGGRGLFAGAAANFQPALVAWKPNVWCTFPIFQ